MSTLLDRLNEPPARGWRPKPGDIVTGVVESVDVAASDYGGDYPVVIVRTDDGLVAVHGFHTVLKRELARRRPEPGDSIGIKYLGRVDGAKYESYKVIVDKAEPDTAAVIDWDALEAADAADRDDDDAAELHQLFDSDTF